MRTREDVLIRFRSDTAAHTMTVLHDHGTYRHLRFRKPGTSCYGFDIVTWPGYLAISGDMGAALFTRLEDMLEFFRASEERIAAAAGGLPINPEYWAEKCVANDGPKKEFSSELFHQIVKKKFDEFVAENTEDEGPGPEWADQLWEELETFVLFDDEDVEATGRAIENMDDFKPDGESYKHFGFSDPWEYGSSLEDFRFHFMWRLYAIAYAVQIYDRAAAATAEVPHG